MLASGKVPTELDESPDIFNLVVMGIYVVVILMGQVLFDVSPAPSDSKDAPILPLEGRTP